MQHNDRQPAALVKYHKIFISISFAFFELRLHFHSLYFMYPCHLFCILVLFVMVFIPGWIFFVYILQLRILFHFPVRWKLFCYSFVNIKIKKIVYI